MSWKEIKVKLWKKGVWPEKICPICAGRLKKGHKGMEYVNFTCKNNECEFNVRE